MTPRHGGSTSAKYYDGRWRLTRAGIVNVWHYLETEFTVSGGRLILRGANGSGKSRALEMLLPYLLDGDRRRMDATGSNKVDLDELMRTGSRGQGNRLGYLWIELSDNRSHLTLGAHVKYSATAHRSEIIFFITPERVGEKLTLIAANREVITRDELIEVVGSSNISRTPEEHRDAVRKRVFGLRGAAGRERFAGLIQLLHTLRSPDVGNRIDEGRLPEILSDALPPLSEQTLGSAGEQLDALTETRATQQRLESTLAEVDAFAGTYRGYLVSALRAGGDDLRALVTDIRQGVSAETDHADALDKAMSKLSAAQALQRSLAGERDELARAVDAFREHALFRGADDLRQRELTVAAMRHTAEHALGWARRTRIAEVGAANRLIGRYEDVRTAARRSAQALVAALADTAAADIDGTGLPTDIHVVDHPGEPEQNTVADSLDGFPASLLRPSYTAVTTVPEDLDTVALAAEARAVDAEKRLKQARRRLQEARRLDAARLRVRELELAADHARATADADENEYLRAAGDRDDLAIDTVHRWRRWLAAPETADLLDVAKISAKPTVAALLSDVEALSGDATGEDEVVAVIAEPAVRRARERWAVDLDHLRAEDAADDQRREYLLAEQRANTHDPRSLIEDAIGAELLAIDRRAAARAGRRLDIRAQRRALDAHVAAAPSSRPLILARASAQYLRRRAATAAEFARAEEDRAARARNALGADVDHHRLMCGGIGLPSGSEDLLERVQACRRAIGSATALAATCREVSMRVGAAEQAEAELRYATGDRVNAEAEAESRRSEWHSHAATLAAAHDTLDVPTRRIGVELSRTTTQLAQTDTALDAATRAVSEAAAAVASARIDASVAAERVAARSAELVRQVGVHNARIGAVSRALGLGESAPVEPIAHSDDPDHIEELLARTDSVLGDVDAVAVNDLIAALHRFERTASAHLDITHRIENGLYVVDVAGAGDTADPATVADHLRAAVDQGRHTLGERERDVFAGFVVGGVAEELRRRIQQGALLVGAMNTSLRTTRTSHGIGVSMAWVPGTDDPDLARILELLEAGTTDDELIALLRNRVELLHTADPSAGYAAHLETALDYRQWYDVEVTILGPEPGQRRRISKRAKISQGETRFVSYAALFAAADGYLSSLPDADRALRLVLLDDAFAKIDETTIGELMGLLVRLDIDFVMTGHALWGTVEEVPALDIYEIRRVGDSAVITTRVHWDGSRRYTDA